MPSHREEALSIIVQETMPLPTSAVPACAPASTIQVTWLWCLMITLTRLWLALVTYVTF